MMDRRAFISGITAGLLAAPLAAEAQDRTSLPHIGVLFIGRDERIRSYIRAHEDGLRELGWVRNRDLVIDEQFSGSLEHMPASVAELIRLNARAIVTGPNNFIEVAKKVTTTVPIVMVYPADPVGRGYVESLARPGGNITGLSWEAAPEIGGKYVELLMELRPRPSSIVALVDPHYPDHVYRREADRAAKSRGITLRYAELQTATDIPAMFNSIKSGGNAIIVFQGPFLYVHQTQISDLARKHGLPTLSMYREGPEAGGLMSYGPNLRESWRRAAAYVDKILRGAKAGELPVEQPTKFELVINLKTAKALGLTIPQSLLQRADQVIE